MKAQLVIITRALDFPTTRVQILASNLSGIPDAFNLLGTPCQLVYEGQPISIYKGVAQNFPAAKDGSCESFHGFPLFNEQDRCIGHLGLFFSTPSQLSNELTLNLSHIALRLRAELQRLELTAKLETTQRKLELQNRILAMAAANQPLDHTLETLIAGIELEHPEILFSIMQPDRNCQRLFLTSGPSLPPEFALAVSSVKIESGAGSCGTAAFSGERIIVDDISQHPYWVDFRHIALEHGLRSCWSQPIKGNGDELLGVFAIYHRYPCSPSDSETALIDSISDLVSLILGHYQTLNELMRSTHKYRLFLQTSADGLVVLDNEGRFIEISDGFLRQIGANDRQQIANTRIWDWDAILDQTSYREMLASFVHHPVIYETSLRRLDGTIWQAEISATSFSIDGQPMTWASARDISERKLLEAELTLQATTDGLTKLFNRTTFLTAFAAEFQRSQRHKRPLSVLMLDIDYFKSINDRYGHHVGDSVLQKISAIFKEEVRKVDLIGRIGGEEFAVLLPETDLAGARKVAEKIRTRINKHPIELSGFSGTHHLKLSCSIGLASLEVSDQNHEELLSFADKALYEAKNTGRNRISVLEGR